MQLRIYKDYDALSLQAANEILGLIRQKPDSVLCLAAGDTPRYAYALLAKTAADQHVDLRKCTFIGLDEWIGIPPENEGSCHYFLHNEVFKPLQVAPAQIHLFDSMAEDLQLECKTMDEIISAKGGIDLMVVGIGMNGHIGFNEPGVSFDQYCHVASLDESTRAVGQKYFKHPTALTKGVTLGLKHLMQSEKVILMASGSKKAEVIRKAIEEAISPDLPASIVRNHPGSLIMLDEAAASALSRVHNGSASG